MKKSLSKLFFCAFVFIFFLVYILRKIEFSLKKCYNNIVYKGEGPMKTIIIESDYIQLGQFLKFAQLITNGGEAKHYLLSHVVLVNQQLENRRGRKLYPEDQVQVDKEIYLIQKK